MYYRDKVSSELLDMVTNNDLILLNNHWMLGCVLIVSEIFSKLLHRVLRQRGRAAVAGLCSML